MFLHAPAVYAARVPVVEYIAPAPTPVPVVEHISPAPAGYAARVPVVEYIAPAPTPVPVVEHISSSAPAGYAAPAPLVEFIAPSPVASFATPVRTVCVAAPVVEHISLDPAVYAAKGSYGGVHRSCASGELRHGAYSV